MPGNDGLKRYFEAALALTQITRARAEEVVRDLIHSGEVESTKAQDWVEDLVRTSRQRSEAFVSTVRSEVRQQLSEVGITNVDELARRVAAVLDRAEKAARKATSRGAARARPARKAAKKTATRAGAAKTAAKKTAAKKTAAKRTTKSPAKRAPAKKTAAKKTAAKKTGARKAPAKKTTSRRA